MSTTCNMEEKEDCQQGLKEIVRISKRTGREGRKVSCSLIQG